MISGFNTDIEFDGVVYHVQTEDKGLSSKLIVSLIYDGGTILASKRVSYEDLAEGNFDETAITDRLNRQHKLICAAVKAGRIEDLKSMSRKAVPAAAAATPSVSTIPIAPVPLDKPDTERIATFTPPDTVEVFARTEQLPDSAPAFVPPSIVPEIVNEPILTAEDFFADAPLFEDVQIIEDDVIEIDAAAVEVVSELSGVERPTNDKLSIELLGDSKFAGGDRRTVNIMLCRGTARRVIGGAQIMIKVLGSSFRPVIFHAKTDNNGLASVHLQLPHFQAGRAALLIRAMSDGEEIELRRVVTPG
ncbi:MAG: hypothetical protein IPG67_04375 [Acidobacteria bacterium]|nr:hypothetical protein [Acidobacteriota bacterium]